MGIEARWISATEVLAFSAGLMKTIDSLGRWEEKKRSDPVMSVALI